MVCHLLFYSIPFNIVVHIYRLMQIITKANLHPDIDYREGAVILIDKPAHWTSFDVVNKIRSRLRYKYDIKRFKVGHNGTLDPLATGLLMIFTGKYTKRIPLEENHDKGYDGKIKLGVTTASLDCETEEINLSAFDHVTLSAINEAANSFIGIQEQEIPIYSATKVGGERMYKMARKDQEVAKKFKTVEFKTIEIQDYVPPFIDFSLLCGKGTYVRAFARDLGIKLNTTAYLYTLRRTSIGEHHVENALSVEEFCTYLEEN